MQTEKNSADGKRVGSDDGLGDRCPYLLVADSSTTLCVWNGRRNPRGCEDDLVRLFRIGRGEILQGKMMCDD